MESRQRWIALLLFVLSTGLYLLTRQQALFNDGIFFEGKLRAGDLAYGQILYLPLVWVVWASLGTVFDLSAETALKVVSALAGGLGVALTFLIACQALTSALRALAAALLLAGLYGYWFHSTATELHMVHATCALVLFLGLIHTVHFAQTADRAARLDPGTIALLFLGTGLTLASHTSGIALLLPTLYVAWVTRRARPAQGQLLIAVGAGVLAFAACYLWLASSHPEMQKYADDHAGKMLSLVTDAGTLPAKVLSVGRELLVFAVPASALVPAGLRVLFHTAPQHAWLLLLWVVAWPLVVLPVEDFAVGSYHMPTLPVQALLAVIAWHGVATSIPRALLVLAVATLPAAVGLLALHQQQGRAAFDMALLAWAVCSTVLFVLARSHTPQPRWLLALPVTGLLLSATVLPPALGQDSIRDHIRQVQAVVRDGDVVCYVTHDTAVHHHWRRFFPRAVNLLLLDAQPDLLPDLQTLRSIWLVGDLEGAAGGPRFQEFRTRLLQQFSKARPEGAPEGMFLLTRRR